MKVGSGIFRTNVDSQWNAVYNTHFVELFVVEMKHSVSSNVHVILMRQTCGQRSSMVAGSERRATIC